MRVLPDEDVVEGQQDGAQRHGEHVENHRENSTTISFEISLAGKLVVT